MSSLNLNKVILVGRLTAEPELKQTPSGVSVIRVTVGNRLETDCGVYFQVFQKRFRDLHHR